LTPAELLAPHAKRKVRHFIDDGDAPFEAFWSLIYGGVAIAVDYTTAVAVERELERTDKRVSDVLNGWRPAALSWTKPGPGGDA
jgi:hypothetical protein